MDLNGYSALYTCCFPSIPVVPTSDLESGMPRMTSCLAMAWLLMAPLTAAAATALQSPPPDGSAVTQDIQRYVQNDAIGTQPPAEHTYPQAQGPAQVYL